MNTLTMDRLLFISLLFLGILHMEMGTIMAVSSTDAYWHKVLPNTPIPSALKDLLQPTLDATSFHVSRINPDKNNFFYSMASVEVSNDPDLSLYFMEKDLRPGTVMTLKFARTISSISPFLPRKVADAIPFSSDKLPEILDRLSVRPGTPEAAAVEGTVRDCEKPPFEGETRYCATSFESMVDYTSSELKTRNVMPVVTTSANGGKLQSTSKQQYTIASSGVRQIGGSEMVVCHPMTYPHAVFFCHRIPDTKAFIVPMVGKDGTAVEAAAICHFDTSKWNPDHLSFQVLKVRPGTPVCHILQRDILWSSKN